MIENEKDFMQIGDEKLLYERYDSVHIIVSGRINLGVCLLLLKTYFVQGIREKEGHLPLKIFLYNVPMVSNNVQNLYIQNSSLYSDTH